MDSDFDVDDAQAQLHDQRRKVARLCEKSEADADAVESNNNDDDDDDNDGESTTTRTGAGYAAWAHRGRRPSGKAGVQQLQLADVVKKEEEDDRGQHNGGRDDAMDILAAPDYAPRHRQPRHQVHPAPPPPPLHNASYARFPGAMDFAEHPYHHHHHQFDPHHRQARHHLGPVGAAATAAYLSSTTRALSGTQVSGGGGGGVAASGHGAMASGDEHGDPRDDEPGDFTETNCHWKECSLEFGTQDELVRVSTNTLPLP